MASKLGFTTIGLSAVVALSLTLAACSDDGGSNSLTGPGASEIGADLGEQQITESQAVPGLDGGSAGALEGSSNRIEAELNPVRPVDASGKARLENEGGTANDRFDSEIEIAKQDFGALDIDAGDGFQDEVVRIVATRDGTRVFAGRMRFSENRPRDITFELTLRGGPAPELRVGDVIVVNVNGNRTLRGVMRNDN